MKRTGLLITVLIILSTFSVPASGNGGPVDWTKTTPMGGVALNDSTGIRLEYESLHIRLHDDLNTYTVVATYHLRNDGEEKSVTFGVPLTWTKYIGKEHLQKKIKLVSGQVVLELDGTSVSCSVPTEGQAADAGLKGGPKEWFFGKYKFESWCLANLKVPGGSRPVLTMRYVGELFYIDWEFSKSALTMFGERRLWYVFYPAGFWEGKVGKVDITLDLGPYRNHLMSTAPEFTDRTDSTLTWHLKDADFTELTALKVDLLREALEERQLMRWNRDALPYRKSKLEASASSSLPDSDGLSYAPSNVTDGDERTAWCEGADGDGTGEWLELRLLDLKEKQSAHYCRLEGVTIVPGYAKSEKSYLDNGRVRKVRISHCDTDSSFTSDVPLQEDLRMSAYLIENRMDEAGEKFMKEFERKHGDNYSHPDYRPPADILDFIKEEGCFRVEILEVEKGRSDDTCISEIAVVFNCF